MTGDEGSGVDQAKDVVEVGRGQRDGQEGGREYAGAF